MAFRYRVIDRIGAGGMGIVYRAHDPSLERDLALKILPERSLRREDTRARFLREARLAAALNHPNICTVHDVGEIEPHEERDLPDGTRLQAGTPYIAMELIAGESLDQLLARSGRLELQRLLKIAVQVAEGLAAAHERGIVHRDLKPHNVMLTPEGRVKVLDFGLAKQIASEVAAEETTIVGPLPVDPARTDGAVGTLHYMSPEQALGRSLDPRSDIFSFGAMLYEMATGLRPFHGDSATSTIAKILEAEPVSLVNVREELPPQLGRIVHRCLRKQPQERYSSARDLVAVLSDLLEESSQDSGWGRSAPRHAVAAARAGRVRRRWWWAAAVGIVAILAGLAVVRLLGRAPATAAAPQYRRLTNSGQAYYPHLSPDGQFLGYVDLRGREPDRLVVRDLVGGQEITVREARTISCWMAWSPDGSRLAFTECDLDGRWSHRIVPRLGGATQEIGDSSWSGVALIGWLADGQRVAAIGGGDHTPPSRRIHLLDVASGDTSSVPAGGGFSRIYDGGCSRDGRLFAFTAYDSEMRSRLWAMTADGRRHLLAESAGFLWRPRFSPGGDAVYYCAPEPGGGTAIRRVRIDSRSGARRDDPEDVLTGQNLAGFSASDISADGRTLALARGSGRSRLWMLTAASRSGAPSARLVSTGGEVSSFGSFSPSGDEIAYLARAGEQTELFIAPLEGGTARQVTNGAAIAGGWLAWSPDGKRIAGMRASGDSFHVAIATLSGGRVRVLGQSRLDWKPVLEWAPGERILYRKMDGYHWLDPDTGLEEPFFGELPESTYVDHPCYSSDGRMIAWSVIETRGAEPALQCTWVTRSSDRSLMRRLDVEGIPVGWSPDGASVLLLQSGTPPALVSCGVATGEADTLYTISLAGDVGYGRMSPDGLRFLALATEEEADIWLVEGFDPGRR